MDFGNSIQVMRVCAVVMAALIAPSAQADNLFKTNPDFETGSHLYRLTSEPDAIDGWHAAGDGAYGTANDQPSVGVGNSFGYLGDFTGAHRLVSLETRADARADITSGKSYILVAHARTDSKAGAQLTDLYGAVLSLCFYAGKGADEKPLTEIAQPINTGSATGLVTYTLKGNTPAGAHFAAFRIESHSQYLLDDVSLVPAPPIARSKHAPAALHTRRALKN